MQGKRWQRGRSIFGQQATLGLSIRWYWASLFFFSLFRFLLLWLHFYFFYLVTFVEPWVVFRTYCGTYLYLVSGTL